MISRREFLEVSGIGITAFATMGFIKSMSAPMIQKGLAMAYPEYQEDLVRTGASWYYNWSLTIAENCVPMSRDGNDPNLPADYDGYVLLFNEPNNPGPYGHPISPNDASVIYKDLCARYPLAKWVVGNVNIYTRRWMEDFWHYCRMLDCPMPEYLGWHIYISESNEAENLNLFLDGIHHMNYPNTKWWITEFADVTGDVYNDALMMSEFKKRSWIERYAYFTNRAKGNEAWYPAGWNVQLFDWVTGEPSKIGKWYMSELHKTYMPIVMR